MSILDILGIFALFFGLFFYIMGVIGLLRFPDIYSRIHAAGKVSILGVSGLVIACALLAPQTTPKVVALGIFYLIVQPAASHSVASAAHRTGVPVAGAVRDDLRRDRGKVPADERDPGVAEMDVEPEASEQT